MGFSMKTRTTSEISKNRVKQWDDKWQCLMQHLIGRTRGHRVPERGGARAFVAVVHCRVVVDTQRNVFDLQLSVVSDTQTGYGVCEFVTGGCRQRRLHGERNAHAPRGRILVVHQCPNLRARCSRIKNERKTTREQ